MTSAPVLPYGSQWLDEDDVRAVVEVLRGDWLTTGPAVERFEQSLVRASGARFAVAVSSGTAALHAMYAALGVGRGDEVVTSPLTFCATANAALYLGANVRYADVEPETGNLDPESLARAVTPRTKLVVAIDFTGHPADYASLHEVALRHGFGLAADAAHSLGARYHGRGVGTLADATSVSLHPVKPVTTGEGGAVLTDDPEVARRAARFRTHGIERDPSRLERPDEGPWYHEQQELGFNYRLTDVQSALGASQMAKLDRFLERRRAIARRYLEAFADLPELRLPVVRPGVEPGWHLFVVRVAGDPDLRRPFFERLRELGLGVQVHYLPVYLHPYHRRLGHPEGLCPNAEDWYRRAVTIPLFPRMTDEDVERVVATVRRGVAEVLG